jgi:hypothetical protein
MTKIEIINEIIVKKQEELKKAKAICNKLEQGKVDAMFSVMQKYFGGEFTLDDVYIQKPSAGYYSGGSYEIKRPNKDYNYDKELMTIRFHEDWKTSEFDGIETSLYSTSDNSQWELERIFTNGEVAKVLLDHGDDLLAEMNVVRLTNKEEIDTASTESYKIESSISNLKAEINTIQLDEANEKLEGEGLVFGEGKKGAMDIKWDWTIRSINSAKIISKTASGKSCNIEIQAYDYDPVVYEKVRMSNVDALLWQYRDYVINA